MNKINLLDTTLINYYGRILFKEGSINFYNTGSAFEFKFIGSKAIATFSDGFAQKIRVYIDGVDTGIKFIEDSLTICEQLSYEEHTIKVVRVNHEVRGIITLNNLEIDGEILTTNKKPVIKFEFFGDSITAGYGVNQDGTEDTISNEDGTVTYAYLTTQHFKAQGNFMCYSGVSVSLPYWVEWIVPDRFKRYSYSTEETPWDFTKYIPDYVVINLGTNDSGIIELGRGVGEDFTKEYHRFLLDLRSLYKDSKIICSYGMMGVNEVIRDSIRKAVELSNDSNIYFLEYVPVDCGGYNGHPSKIGQKDGAIQLIKFIEKISNK